MKFFIHCNQICSSFTAFILINDEIVIKILQVCSLHQIKKIYIFKPQRRRRGGGATYIINGCMQQLNDFVNQAKSVWGVREQKFFLHKSLQEALNSSHSMGTCRHALTKSPCSLLINIGWEVGILKIPLTPQVDELFYRCCKYLSEIITQMCKPGKIFQFIL